jgi:hypothetical protein
MMNTRNSSLDIEDLAALLCAWDRFSSNRIIKAIQLQTLPRLQSCMADSEPLHPLRTHFVNQWVRIWGSEKQ